MAPPVYHVRTNLTPPEVVGALSDSGYARLMQSPFSLAAASILGGIIVGGFGHCCSLGCGRLTTWTDDFVDPQSNGMATIAYGLHFFFAFFAIASTGTALFTSDCLYSIVYWVNNILNKTDYHKISIGKASLRALLALLISFSGNLLGCVVAASLWSWAGDYLRPVEDPSHKFLCSIAKGKIGHGHPYWALIANGIGANFFVALSTVGLKGTLSAEGALAACVGPIINFCIGGFQHVVANMYTLHAAVFVKCPGVDYGDVWTRNMLPVLLGNFIGALLVGAGIMAVHGAGTNNYGLNVEAITVVDPHYYDGAANFERDYREEYSKSS